MQKFKKHYYRMIARKKNNYNDSKRFTKCVKK